MIALWSVFAVFLVAVFVDALWFVFALCSMICDFFVVAIVCLLCVCVCSVFTGVQMSTIKKHHDSTTMSP